MKYVNIKHIIFIFYILFVAVSFLFGIEGGKVIGYNFVQFFIDMIKIIPCAFILIGLFDVWVKRENVEKHLGQDSNWLAYLWVILLSGTTVGGMYIAFPIAYTLFQKGAKLSIVFTYLASSAVCRVTMTIFEASFLGIKFSLIRLFVSIPLIIISSIFLGNYLEKTNYSIKDNT